jgi:hypothetical protein
MNSCGATLEAYHTVRKVFCQHLPDITMLTLLKLLEMDMHLAPLSDDWKIWSRSSFVLKDISVGTELILFCGPRYFGIFRERTRLCVDGEDGIGK